LPWWLERWHWENMCLLVQNMEPNIPNNGSEKISKHHVWLCVISHEHNEINVSLSSLWPSYICIEKNHEPWGGKPNLVRNSEEKMSKAILKDRIIRWTKSQAIELGLPQHLNQVQWQLKNNFKMMLENECPCTLSNMFS